MAIDPKLIDELLANNKKEDRSQLQMCSRLAALVGIMCLLSDFAPVRSQARNHPDASDLGAIAAGGGSLAI